MMDTTPTLDEPAEQRDRTLTFGNWCTRVLAPAGDFCLSTDGVFRDTGQPDPSMPGARQHAVQDLPFETLVFLQGSRYCDTDLLSEETWRLFETTDAGWSRVQAICDFVHGHVRFDYMQGLLKKPGDLASLGWRTDVAM